MVTFPFVLIAGEYLHVGRHMQAADGVTAQRNDVVDFVPYACQPRESGGFFVELADRLRVSPLRRRLKFRRVALRDVRVDLLRVVPGPLAITAAHMLGILCSPALRILAPFVLVSSVPFSKRVRVVTLPSVAMSIHARLASCGQAIWRGPVYVEQREWVNYVANGAAFQAIRLKQSTRGALCREMWSALMRPTSLAEARHSMRAAIGALARCLRLPEHSDRFGLLAAGTCLLDSHVKTFYQVCHAI